MSMLLHVRFIELLHQIRIHLNNYLRYDKMLECAKQTNGRTESHNVLCVSVFWSSYFPYYYYQCYWYLLPYRLHHSTTSVTFAIIAFTLPLLLP